jgi:DNA-binding response OmpR family regulator
MARLYMIDKSSSLQGQRLPRSQQALHRGQQMRVLFVEDNKDTLASLAAVLRFQKYDLITAPDGPIALEMAKLYLPDVVLLDIGLPGMNGYEVARALRKQISDRTLYIAAITGHGTPDDKRRATEAGIDAHLTKPAHAFVITQLLDDFEAKLRNRTQRAAA